jgi:uncharacterized membrane protein
MDSFRDLIRAAVIALYLLVVYVATYTINIETLFFLAIIAESNPSVATMVVMTTSLVSVVAYMVLVKPLIKPALYEANLTFFRYVVHPVSLVLLGVMLGSFGSVTYAYYTQGFIFPTTSSLLRMASSAASFTFWCWGIGVGIIMVASLIKTVQRKISGER